MKEEIIVEPKQPAGTLRALAKDTRGAGLVEYIVLVGLIALAAIMGFQTMGDAVNERAGTLGGRISGIGN
jgi:pilus assembly protein Flp/PilA